MLRRFNKYLIAAVFLATLYWLFSKEMEWYFALIITIVFMWCFYWLIYKDAKIDGEEDVLKWLEGRGQKEYADAYREDTEETRKFERFFNIFKR